MTTKLTLPNAEPDSELDQSVLPPKIRVPGVPSLTGAPRINYTREATSKPIRDRNGHTVVELTAEPAGCVLASHRS